ncbi:MAG: hypothetical protein WCI55_00340 [Armatimonadota bacterium]
MKVYVGIALLFVARVSFATDHNNIETGRPLLFDDAYSIAFGEREFQVGLNTSAGKFGLMTSFGYGFAKNQELSIGFNTLQGSSNGYELSFFQNLAREVENSPALGFRLTARATPGTKPSGQLRMIVTKALHQYDKVHLNLDLNTNESPGLIFGYSNPLGYPKKFDLTLVSELAFEHKETSLGIGIRKQIDARSTLDLGMRAGKQVQFIGGVSISF